jgi:hypothetical protein
VKSAQLCVLTHMSLPGLWINPRYFPSELSIVERRPMDLLKPSPRLDHVWGDETVQAGEVTL